MKHLELELSDFDLYCLDASTDFIDHLESNISIFKKLYYDQGEDFWLRHLLTLREYLYILVRARFEHEDGQCLHWIINPIEKMFIKMHKLIIVKGFEAIKKGLKSIKRNKRTNLDVIPYLTHKEKWQLITSCSVKMAYRSLFGSNLGNSKATTIKIYLAVDLYKYFCKTVSVLLTRYENAISSNNNKQYWKPYSYWTTTGYQAELFENYLARVYKENLAEKIQLPDAYKIFHCKCIHKCCEIFIKNCSSKILGDDGDFYKQKIYQSCNKHNSCYLRLVHEENCQNPHFCAITKTSCAFICDTDIYEKNLQLIKDGKYWKSHSIATYPTSNKKYRDVSTFTETHKCIKTLEQYPSHTISYDFDEENESSLWRELPPDFANFAKQLERKEKTKSRLRDKLSKKSRSSSRDECLFHSTEMLTPFSDFNFRSSMFFHAKTVFRDELGEEFLCRILKDKVGKSDTPLIDVFEGRYEVGDLYPKKISPNKSNASVGSNVPCSWHFLAGLKAMHIKKRLALQHDTLILETSDNNMEIKVINNNDVSNSNINDTTASNSLIKKKGKHSKKSKGTNLDDINCNVSLNENRYPEEDNDLTKADDTFIKAKESSPNLDLKSQFPKNENSLKQMKTSIQIENKITLIGNENPKDDIQQLNAEVTIPNVKDKKIDANGEQKQVHECLTNLPTEHCNKSDITNHLTNPDKDTAELKLTEGSQPKKVKKIVPVLEKMKQCIADLKARSKALNTDLEQPREQNKKPSMNSEQKQMFEYLTNSPPTEYHDRSNITTKHLSESVKDTTELKLTEGTQQRKVKKTVPVLETMKKCIAELKAKSNTLNIDLEQPEEQNEEQSKNREFMTILSTDRDNTNITKCLNLAKDTAELKLIIDSQQKIITVKPVLEEKKINECLSTIKLKSSPSSSELKQQREQNKKLIRNSDHKTMCEHVTKQGNNSNDTKHSIELTKNTAEIKLIENKAQQMDTEIDVAILDEKLNECLSAIKFKSNASKINSDQPKKDNKKLNRNSEEDRKIYEYIANLHMKRDKNAEFVDFLMELTNDSSTSQLADNDGQKMNVKMNVPTLEEEKVNEHLSTTELKSNAPIVDLEQPKEQNEKLTINSKSSINYEQKIYEYVTNIPIEHINNSAFTKKLMDLARDAAGVKIISNGVEENGPSIIIFKEKSTFVRICAYCGKLEPSRHSFKKCKLCKDQNVKNARYYCSRSCQATDWKENHQSDHKNI